MNMPFKNLNSIAHARFGWGQRLKGRISENDPIDDAAFGLVPGAAEPLPVHHVVRPDGGAVRSVTERVEDVVSERLQSSTIRR